MPTRWPRLGINAGRASVHASATGIRHGAPSRRDVLDLLAAGVSEKEILEDYPDLEAKDIKACLQYAAAQADHAVLKVP